MCNQNQFDFYTVEAYASRVGDLVRAGIPRASCHKRYTGKHRVYGRKTFPITRWEAVVGYVDVCADNSREQLAEMESQHKSDGVRIHARYHAMD
jgi:hypothetical protein